MRRWLNILLACFAALAATPAVAQSNARYSIIEDPYDQRPGAVTRPANRADRAWRKGRRTPEIVIAPRPRAFRSRSHVAPRYDGRGRRLNVPGRPETYDQIGRSQLFPGRPRVDVAPIGPTVRTDAATRINQLPPR